MVLAVASVFFGFDVVDGGVADHGVVATAAACLASSRAVLSAKPLLSARTMKAAGMGMQKRDSACCMQSAEWRVERPSAEAGRLSRHVHGMSPMVGLDGTGCGESRCRQPFSRRRIRRDLICLNFSGARKRAPPPNRRAIANASRYWVSRHAKVAWAERRGDVSVTNLQHDGIASCVCTRDHSTVHSLCYPMV